MRQTVTAEERDLAMGITPDMEQCGGCPDTSLRRVPQGGRHLDRCSECARHCQCDRDTMGAGWR